MKKVILRRFFVLCVVALMLATFSVSAFALEAESTEVYATHTHSWVFSNYSYVYTSKDSSTHTVEKYEISNCSCGLGRAVSVSKTTEDHTIASYFTGNHYHISNTTKHTAEYELECTKCGYVLGTQWDTYTCPGNGACIYP